MRKTKTYRILSDRGLIGLYLLYRASREHKDGVLITNVALHQLIGKATAYDKRTNDFARTVNKLFPYSKIEKDDKNRKTLYLGFKSAVKPSNPVRITSIPPRQDIEKLLGFATLTLDAPW